MHALKSHSIQSIFHSAAGASANALATVVANSDAQAGPLLATLVMHSDVVCNDPMVQKSLLGHVVEVCQLCFDGWWSR